MKPPTFTLLSEIGLEKDCCGELGSDTNGLIVMVSETLVAHTNMNEFVYQKNGSNLGEVGWFQVEGILGRTRTQQQQTTNSARFDEKNTTFCHSAPIRVRFVIGGAFLWEEQSQNPVSRQPPRSLLFQREKMWWSLWWFFLMNVSNSETQVTNCNQVNSSRWTQWLKRCCGNVVPKINCWWRYNTSSLQNFNSNQPKKVCLVQGISQKLYVLRLSFPSFFHMSEGFRMYVGGESSVASRIAHHFHCCLLTFTHPPQSPDISTSLFIPFPVWIKPMWVKTTVAHYLLAFWTKYCPKCLNCPGIVWAETSPFCQSWSPPSLLFSNWPQQHKIVLLSARPNETETQRGNKHKLRLSYRT